MQEWRIVWHDGNCTVTDYFWDRDEAVAWLLEHGGRLAEVPYGTFDQET